MGSKKVLHRVFWGTLGILALVLIGASRLAYANVPESATPKITQTITSVENTDFVDRTKSTSQFYSTLKIKWDFRSIDVAPGWSFTPHALIESRISQGRTPDTNDIDTSNNWSYSAGTKIKAGPWNMGLSFARQENARRGNQKLTVGYTSITNTSNYYFGFQQPEGLKFTYGVSTSDVSQVSDFGVSAPGSTSTSTAFEAKYKPQFGEFVLRRNTDETLNSPTAQTSTSQSDFASGTIGYPITDKMTAVLAASYSSNYSSLPGGLAGMPTPSNTYENLSFRLDNRQILRDMSGSYQYTQSRSDTNIADANREKSHSFNLAYALPEEWSPGPRPMLTMRYAEEKTNTPSANSINITKEARVRISYSWNTFSELAYVQSVSANRMQFNDHSQNDYLNFQYFYPLANRGNAVISYNHTLYQQGYSLTGSNQNDRMGFSCRYQITPPWWAEFRYNMVTQENKSPNRVDTVARNTGRDIFFSTGYQVNSRVGISFNANEVHNIGPGNSNRTNQYYGIQGSISFPRRANLQVALSRNRQIDHIYPQNRQDEQSVSVTYTLSF